MLFEDIESFKKFGACPKIPEYISENLKFPLYEWQKVAIENFLINETGRKSKIESGEKLVPNHLMFNMATGAGKTLVMAAMILYYYKEFKITNFIFFVNQNAIVGKTQDNFINKGHSKVLRLENVSSPFVGFGSHTNFGKHLFSIFVLPIEDNLHANQIKCLYSTLLLIKSIDVI